MKKSILAAALTSVIVATPAFAQDATPFTGPYVGGVLGVDSVELDSAGLEGDDQGTVYGGVIGYDMNLGGFIVGVEGEYTDSEAGHSERNILVAGDEASLNAGRDLYAGARLGYQIDPNAMLYVKGGYTNAKAKLSYDDNAGNAFSGSDELDGYRVGGGLEASANNMFVRLEYRYSDYGKYETSSLVPNIDTSRHQGVVMAGIRF
ncbi:outer membrane protein [Parasphingorhabdus sp.]|uniref:outer membrane protein n=1 Tax=Parasphingorhabdus sp. TaxID=2709688 RepID=UPI0030032CB9